MLLPAVGIVADVITTFSRKKLFGYKTVLYTAIGTGRALLHRLAHHQFIAGIDPRMANVFTVTTLLISVPIAEMMFVYIATLYGGSITLTTPMLWALAFIFEFLIGGITGIFLGASGQRASTCTTPTSCSRTFTTPSIRSRSSGPLRVFSLLVPEDVRADDERDASASWHFWLSIIPFNTDLPAPLRAGRGGSASPDLRLLELPGAGAAVDAGPARAWPPSRSCVMLGAQLIFVYNFFKSMDLGRARRRRTPGTQTRSSGRRTSPPPHGNWPEGLPTGLPRSLRVQRRRIGKRTTGRRTSRPDRGVRDRENGQASSPGAAPEASKTPPLGARCDLKDRRRRCPRDRLQRHEAPPGCRRPRLAVWWVIALGDRDLRWACSAPTSCTRLAHGDLGGPRGEHEYDDRR